MFKIKNNQEFIPLVEKKYKELTSKDHLWVNVQLKLKNLTKSINNNENPLIVITMERKEGVYGYAASEIKNSSSKNKWINFNTQYLTPDIRNNEDLLKCYIWNKSNDTFEIKDLDIEIFERK